MAEKRGPGGALPGQTGTQQKPGSTPTKGAQPVKPNKDFKGGGSGKK